MHFAVVNRAWTTSETPDILLIIHFFVLRINDIVLIAIVLMLPSYMRKLPNNPYWTFRDDSLELLELSSINKVSLDQK